MRVIKFRVWDCELKEMIYDAQSDGFTDFLHQESRYKVMQFTGLLDKSGKEIWEGDITQVGDKNHVLEVVEFRKGSFIQVSLAGQIRLLGNHHPSWFEVLGNIYENPELLK